MSLHLNLSTGKFLNSSTLFKLSDALLLDVSSGEIVMSNLLVPRAGVDLFKLASLDLNFAQRKALTDRVSGNNLITFSRASSGTYVGSDGLIKTSPVNLIKHSQAFSATSWANRRTVDSVTAETLDPLGGSTATKLLDTTDNNTHRLDSVLSSGTLSGNTTYTFSVFAKQAEYSHVSLTIGKASNAFANTIFDINSGTVVSTTTGYTGSIKLIGNGWYRCSATTTLPLSVSHQAVLIGILPDSATTSFAGTGTSGVYIWGAQLEEGTTATDYIPTGATISGAPRFDHDPLNGESLGLLIEEDRANIMLNSGTTAEMIAPASSGVTRTSGGFAAPDGSTEASRVDVPAVTGPDQAKIITEQFTGLSTSTGYAASIYLKGVNGGELVYLTFESGAPTGFIAANLTTEWQRFDITGTTNTSVLYFNVGVDTRAGTGQANQSAQSFYVWGAQVEAGSFPTSYIPTTGAAVTRAVDIASIEGNKFAKTNLLSYSERFDQSGWTEFLSGSAPSLTLTPNYSAGPNGVSDSAFRLQASISGATNSDIALIQQQTTGTQNETGSLYIKSNTGSNQTVYFRTTANDLWSTAIATAEWTRVSKYTTSNLDPVVTIGLRGSATGASSIDISIWGAQLEEGSELTEYTPSVESFDSRASSATYVGSDGLIKTTPVNHSLHSEEINNWVLVTGTVSSNSAESPIGDQTADKWIPNTTSNFHYPELQTSLSSTSSVTYSIYAKQAGYRYLLINTTTGSSSGNAGPLIDLQEGVVVDNFAATYDTTVTDAGNGWLRVAFTFTGNGVNIKVDHNPFPTSTIVTYAGDGTSGVLLWGAQLEESSTASPYIKTTNTISGAARYENGELLLEESRTNLVLNSVSGQIHSTTNMTGPTSVYGPGGADTAFQYLSTGGTVSSRIQFKSVPVVTGTQYTATIYVKGVNYNTVTFGFGAQGFESGVRRKFFLDTLTSVGTSGSAAAALSIEDAGNGWRRIRVTTTATTSATGATPYLDLGSGSDDAHTTDQGFQFYGFQVEAGTFPTSYIPTSGSTVTRAVDISTSALGVDSWYNQSEGTVFIRDKVNPSDPYSMAWVLQNTTNTNDGSVSNYLDPSGYWTSDSRNNGVNFDLIRSNVPGSFVKRATGLKNDDIALAVNGSITTAQIGAITASTSILYIGQRPPSYFYNGHISRLAYFPTRKTDQELIDLTS